MKASIFLAPAHMMSEFYFKDSQVIAKQLLVDNAYIAGPVIEVEAEDGEAAADQMFDLTNSPFRQEERVEKYGRGRSLSIGDIVEYDGQKFLCASFGWVVV